MTWSLVEAGQMEEKTMPYGWMPPTGPEPGLNVLFYPKIPKIAPGSEAVRSTSP